MIEIFAFTPENVGLDTIAAHAKRVEAMGFDGLYVPDVTHDGLLLACQGLAATQRIRVALSVLIAFLLILFTHHTTTYSSWAVDK